MAAFKKNARCTDGNDLAIQSSILKTDQPTTFIKTSQASISNAVKTKL
ncbi:hypothetical protein SynBIOSE41_04004 [Synechococcus sp. BIOS-E4-1]|nr:hypothetical protein SynBIOSE41_04004 [Synechococcus sp. BIOS-E4-1]